MLKDIFDKAGQLSFQLFHHSTFKSLGAKSRVVAPFRIDGGRAITIGTATLFQRGAWLYCGSNAGRRGSLRVGSGCEFGYNNHIVAVGDMVIGDAVLTANNVYISDNLHQYEDINVPIMRQPVRLKKTVTIGSGTWIGENACIIGASIGRNCVIGANAVVTSDVPDYCVVAGIPAAILKQYDHASRTWVTRR